MVIAGAAVFASMLAVGFAALWSDCRRRLSACARMVAELERGRVAAAAKVQQAERGGGKAARGARCAGHTGVAAPS